MKTTSFLKKYIKLVALFSQNIDENCETVQIPFLRECISDRFYLHVAVPKP